MDTTIDTEDASPARRWVPTTTISRRHALGLLGMGLVAAACGSAGASTTTAKGTGSPSASGAPEKTSLKYQGNLDSVTFPELAQDLGYLAPITLDWVGNTTSGPQDIQSAATSQTDIGAAFNGAITNLIVQGAPITSVVSVGSSDKLTYEGLYVLAGSSIRTPHDLIGKKIGVNTAGAQDEAVMDIWLTKSGLSAKQAKGVELVVVPPVNAEQALREKQLDGVYLSGLPLDLALSHGGIRSVLTDIELFGAYDGDSYVLRNSFIKQYPNTARLFVTATAKAIEWAQTTPSDQVVARFTSIINRRHRNGETTASIKYWKSTGVATRGGVIQDVDFERWFPWLTSRGDLKASQAKASLYYTNEFNPFRTDPTLPPTAS